MSRLKSWLDQPEQYDWVTSFLRQRGMLWSARAIMATVAMSAATVPLSMLFSHPQDSTRAVIIGMITAAYTVGMAVFWLAGWPTRRQSLTALAVAVLCIGAWVVAQPNAILATLACTPMAVTGGYSAVFHSPTVLLLHAVVAVTIATAAALRLSHQSDIPATSVFWLINFVTLSVSLGFWGMSRGIRMYAQRSEEDDLTGLLNRRALSDAVALRLAHPPPGHAYLAVVMVDLDDFKRLNDTLGHSAGDEALQLVAGLLRQHAPADAIICRAGGEEFLIALTSASPDLRPLAARLCAAIAAVSPAVTASIGTACAELRTRTGALLEELIKAADTAMYAAKRNGGNQARHTAHL
ncbi:GGDEF domain-containing protein [Mycobacterium parmense]|uniref:Uncharacterized protein n=1 Tax=Mycobacterium parmense TaxID=185642 RepID=A0A7I7YSG7_9MYCO|nr:GGDEF domain-containing protein [Mycobacterium parmense]MCV7349668.1 GGDEF domain-containing protein [Mycobacterium parmense]ORW51872.1 hypothetical protein AWC20_22310 [Mycobacterium parmense]BBZ43681.1 hypothetical protein MPRM_09620 [Mycobacterium parmense]